MITSADDTQRCKATNSCCMYISLVPPPPPEINHARIYFYYTRRPLLPRSLTQHQLLFHVQIWKKINKSKTTSRREGGKTNRTACGRNRIYTKRREMKHFCLRPENSFLGYIWSLGRVNFTVVSVVNIGPGKNLSF
jgi:hypothetical protein